jgi:hypothetical protein
MKQPAKPPTLSTIAAVMSHISKMGHGACKARTREQLANAVKARWDGKRKSDTTRNGKKRAKASKLAQGATQSRKASRAVRKAGSDSRAAVEPGKGIPSAPLVEALLLDAGHEV